MTTTPDYNPATYTPFAVTADLSIFTVRGGVLQVLLVERGGDPYRGYWALPGGFTNPEESTDAAAYRELAEETGLDLRALNRERSGSERVHLEQVKTYSAPQRDPRMRVVSVAYMALAAHLPTPRASSDAAQVRWWPVEDVLGEEPEVELAFDHREILTDARERVRAKLEYTTMAALFLEETFTLHELWRIYGAVWGEMPLLSNFRRKVLSIPGFVEATEELTEGSPGPKAKLYRRGPALTFFPPLRRE